jgi:hypothetical protein
MIAALRSAIHGNPIFTSRDSIIGSGISGCSGIHDIDPIHEIKAFITWQ